MTIYRYVSNLTGHLFWHWTSLVYDHRLIGEAKRAAAQIFAGGEVEVLFRCVDIADPLPGHNPPPPGRYIVYFHQITDWVTWENPPLLELCRRQGEIPPPGYHDCTIILIPVN